MTGRGRGQSKKREARPTAFRSTAPSPFLDLPVLGHTTATLSLARELVARGNRLAYWSTDKSRARIEATGAEFRSYGAASGIDIPRTAGNVFRTAAVLLRVTERQLPRLLGELRAEVPDCIIHGSMCAWGKYAARITGIPAVCTVTTFAFDPQNRTGSPAFRQRLPRLLPGGMRPGSPSMRPGTSASSASPWAPSSPASGGSSEPASRHSARARTG